MDIEIQIVPLPARQFGIAFSLPRSLTFVTATASGAPISIARKSRTLVPGVQLYFLVAKDSDAAPLETSDIEIVVRDRKRAGDIRAKCLDRGWRWIPAVRAGLAALVARQNSAKQDWRALASYMSTVARQEARPFCSLDLQHGRIVLIDGILHLDPATLSCFVFSNSQFRHERCQVEVDREENCTLLRLPKADLAYIDIDGALILCRTMAIASPRKASETTTQALLSLCHKVGDMPEVDALDTKLTLPNSCKLSSGGAAQVFIDGGITAPCGAILSLRVEDAEDLDEISICNLDCEASPFTDSWDMLEWGLNGPLAQVFAIRPEPLNRFGVVGFSSGTAGPKWIRLWHPETRQARQVVKNLRFCDPAQSEVAEKADLLATFRQTMTKSSSLLIRRRSFRQDLVRSPSKTIIVWDSVEDAQAVSATIKSLSQTRPDEEALDFTVVCERPQPTYQARLEQLSEQIDMPIALVGTPYFARADRIFDHCTKDRLGRVLLIQAGAAPKLSADDWLGDLITRFRYRDVVVGLAIANLGSIDVRSSASPVYYFDELCDWICQSAYRSTKIRESETLISYSANYKPMQKSTFPAMELRRVFA